VIFCQWYLHKCRENPNFHQKIIWTDEAHISSDGVFNRHNHHYWSDINPHQTIRRRQQGKFGFNVWVAVFGSRVLAYQIYNQNLNSELYLSVLEEKIIENLENMPLNQILEIYFQQDGAPPHNARRVSKFLNQNFNAKWMGTNGPIRWPPRSPDLTPLDFFFWGHIKDKIYKNKSNTVEELREKFEECIYAIPNLSIFNATRAVVKRCEMCLDNHGRQFEHLR